MKRLAFLIFMVVVLAIPAMAQAPAAPVVAAPDPILHNSVYGGLAYITYNDPTFGGGLLVGQADYKAGFFVGYAFKFNKSWAIATDYSCSWDNLHLKLGVPQIDNAGTVGFTYQALSVGGRYYWHTMFISGGAITAKFKTDQLQDSTKIGGYLGFGGDLDLTKGFFLTFESRYAWLPQVEQVPKKPTNLQGLQTFAGLGFRF